MRAVAAIWALCWCLFSGTASAGSEAVREHPSPSLVATGIFQPHVPLDALEVRSAARLLARAGVVDRSLGSGDGDLSGSTEADLAAALRRFVRAVPFHETWQQPQVVVDGDGRVRQTIRARVALLGERGDLGLRAKLVHSDLWSGDRLMVRVAVSERYAYVAAFAWQADDSVVALSAPGAAAHRIGMDDPVVLPGVGDPEVSVAAMPGSERSFEAVVVVAYPEPFDPVSLASSVVLQSGPQAEAATPTSAFLDALATWDPSRIELAILPYRVQTRLADERLTVTLRGFDTDMQSTIVSVMSEAFAGYRRHVHHPQGPSGLRMDYVSAVPADVMERWLTLLLRDLGLDSDPGVSVSRDGSELLLERRPNDGRTD